jgi:precorrin-2 dehydrogenase/sirohydrochlorin ferrochelatase
MLDLRGRRVVVVGGGTVGARKARDLVSAGASVTLVARKAGEAAEAEGAELLREPYRPEHLEGAALVFACTDDREVNARVAADARARGALVNAADQPEDCDFFVPATAGDGGVVVAVGTGGASPALAGRLARRLAEALPEHVGAYAAALAKVRSRLQAAEMDGDLRRRVLRRLAGEEGYAAFRRGGAKALERAADEWTEGR